MSAQAEGSVVRGRTAMKSVLWAFRVVLFTAAIFMLAYCGFVVVGTWIFQSEQRRQFEQSLRTHKEANGESPQPSRSTSPKDLPPAFTKGVIGRIEVPRLGVSVFVVEGTSSTTLRRAAGHIPGTALPGEPGNVGISAHRDTFFRPLRNIRQNDIITLTTLLGEFRYRVVSTAIVNPSDVGVLNQREDEILTLVTCYPFYFVGSAPNRFIVRAVKVG